MCLGSRSARSSEIIVFFFNRCVLLCCAALFQHISYTTWAPSKRPKKINLRLRNVCSKIRQLDKNNFKDALVGQTFSSFEFCAIFDVFVIIRISHFFLTSFWVQFSRLWWVVQTTFELGQLSFSFFTKRFVLFHIVAKNGLRFTSESCFKS